ncbi:MAG TPA: ABC transporter substrate-binding protein [Candidatus Acidoferrales bacterium]|nr:ABC transporter substrate-binding protein [Candidatus Acidoferrales bacterium]
MPKLRAVVIPFVLAILVIPFAADGAGPKTYLGVSGVSFDYIPFWYAQDYRLYQKYNVDVDMITTGGGTVLAQAMLSGGVHFAAIGTAFLQSAMQGSDHVLLAAHVNYFPYRVVGLPSIAGKEGLRGATIAISRFGSNADAALRIALRQAGLDPAKDVTIIQLGTQPERLAALNGRRVQATIMSPPFSSAAKKAGLKVILDISKMHIAFPEIGLVASRDYVAKNRMNAKGFMQAYLEAIADIKKNRDATVKVLAKYLRLDLESNRDILIDTYNEGLASDELEKKPYPNRDGLKLAVELIAKQRNISPIPPIDNFMDTSLLEELDRSGFIDQLYR